MSDENIEVSEPEVIAPSEGNREAVELVEKFLTVFAKGGISRDDAVSTIQKLFTYSEETIHFITSISSAKKVTVVAAHAVFNDDLFKLVSERVKDLGLYDGEIVENGGSFERLVLTEFLKFSPSVGGDRAEKILEALRSVYLSENVETKRSLPERLLGKNKGV